MRKLLWMLLLALPLCACSDDADEKPDTEHEQVATAVSIFASKDNQKEWVLFAESVNFEDLQSATLYNPSLLLKEDGKDSARVTGKVGIFDYAQKRVTIEGNATIISYTESLKITASRFFYDIDNNRIWSDSKTVITRGSATVTAKGGIVTDNKLSKIELKKQTTRLPLSASELKRN